MISAHQLDAAPLGQFVQTVPICAIPKKSTEAGDRFNAGCCLGLALGLGDKDMLALGCATAGYFVRNASASQAALVEFIRWGWTEAAKCNA